MNPSNSVLHFVSFATAEKENKQNEKDNTDAGKPNITNVVSS